MTICIDVYILYILSTAQQPWAHKRKSKRTKICLYVQTINFFVKYTNDWPDVETYSGSNNPGKVWVW